MNLFVYPTDAIGVAFVFEMHLKCVNLQKKWIESDIFISLRLWYSRRYATSAPKPMTPFPEKCQNSYYFGGFASFKMHFLALMQRCESQVFSNSNNLINLWISKRVSVMPAKSLYHSIVFFMCSHSLFLAWFWSISSLSKENITQRDLNNFHGFLCACIYSCVHVSLFLLCMWNSWFIFFCFHFARISFEVYTQKFWAFDVKALKLIKTMMKIWSGT